MPKPIPVSKPVHKSKSEGIVLIAKDITADDTQDFVPTMIELKHPRTNKKAMFLLSAPNEVQEVVIFSEENRSWFIDESVRSDGRLALCTKVNPAFLALPYLYKAEKLYPLDQALVDSEFGDTRSLVQCLDSKVMSAICDKKGGADMNVWKFNGPKTLTWLDKKVRKVVQVLKANHVSVDTEAAVSNTFVKTKVQSSDFTEDQYLRYAHGIVSEYLPEDLSAQLLTRLGLSVRKPMELKKRNSLAANLPDNEQNKKRIKIENEEDPLFDLVKTEKQTPIKPVKLSAKDKALAKSASGSKPISSFFMKISK